MQIAFTGLEAPRSLARVRGYAYIALALAQLSAGLLVGGDHPWRAAIAPLLMAAVGITFVLRPEFHRPFGSSAPFAASLYVAFGMATAPEALAPFGLAFLTMSVFVGGMILQAPRAAGLTAFATICLTAWSLFAGRAVLPDVILASATLGTAATIAVSLTRVRRAALDQAQLARRDAEELSLKDPLTGLANRRAFDAEANLRTLETRLGGVLMVDIDHFKRVNDEFGHPAGDEVLVAVAQRLASALRRADLAARLGGDEFGVLLEGPLTLEGMRRVADAVRGATSAFAADTQAGHVRVTTSVGGAITPADAPLSRQVRATKALADRALYEAKKAGRDRAVIDGELHAPSARRGRRRPRATRTKAA